MCVCLRLVTLAFFFWADATVRVPGCGGLRNDKMMGGMDAWIGCWPKLSLTLTLLHLLSLLSASALSGTLWQQGSGGGARTSSHILSHPGEVVGLIPDLSLSLLLSLFDVETDSL